MIQTAWGHEVLNQWKCHKRFKEDRQSVGDDNCLGRPSTSIDKCNGTKVNEFVRWYRRLTTREIDEEFNISFSSYQNILKKHYEWVEWEKLNIL